MHALRIAALLLAVIAAGCATTEGLAPTEARAGYDGARVVDIAPHGTACDSTPCAMLGAQWSSARPDSASLILEMTGPQYTNITGARLSLDGTERVLRSSTITRFDPGLGPLMRESKQRYGVDLALIRQIAAAKRGWLRVSTPSGYMDFAIRDGATDSKAFHALRRFLVQIDGTP